jgi:hypothetical protein
MQASYGFFLATGGPSALAIGHLAFASLLPCPGIHFPPRLDACESLAVGWRRLSTCRIVSALGGIDIAIAGRDVAVAACVAILMAATGGFYDSGVSDLLVSPTSAGPSGLLSLLSVCCLLASLSWNHARLRPRS